MKGWLLYSPTHAFSVTLSVLGELENRPFGSFIIAYDPDSNCFIPSSPDFVVVN